MKMDFENMPQQMTYINRLINRKTDLKRICQVCGSPAQIRHNRENPYLIQLICASCKRELGITGKSIDIIPTNIPVIDIRKHLITPIKPFKYRDITETERKMLDFILKENLTKGEISKKFNMTTYTINKLFEKYDEEKPGVLEQYYSIVKEARRQKLIKSTMQRHAKGNPTTLYKIKVERNLSTKDIVELCDNKVTATTINLIIEQKSIPRLSTMQIISKGLKVPIDQLFPEYL